MWDIRCLPFQAVALQICLLAIAGVMEQCSCPVVVLCGLLQTVTLHDFLYGSAVSRECWGVRNLAVFWIQSRMAFEYVESNTKKYSDASFLFLKGTTFLN